MSETLGASLKRQNMKWLVLLAGADVLATFLFVAPELARGVTLTELGVGRVLSTAVLPVVVLLLVNVLPHEVKSSIVFWKVQDALPGCRAFTRYAPRDQRIDMTALKKNVGPFPSEPAEQNAKWYKLYKQVPTEPNVRDAHRNFLLYRDMAALSLPLIVLVPVALHFVGIAGGAVLLAGALFLIQYFLTALSARWSGVRFVCNVLAVHSIRKVR
ncbi:hypothetical protein [Croceicoccus sp. YJ47]|uniref:hypothetical protein n=1 Tax=Croceicoccus sp. YJ47 TaxID=2798724 RepID=UPI001923E417|nr:hypothetical protein [Croceicoccus sp. YJ47]QQN73888.1 hypothetical protein JD971_14235 [Croceicoccus sp. YJ47]